MKSAEMRSKILGMPAHPQIFVDHPLASKTEAEVIAMAEAAVDFFIAAYGVKYDKAVERLVKDRERLLTFYNLDLSRKSAGYLSHLHCHRFKRERAFPA